MSHIYISYGKKNHEYARTLADKLIALGFGVWIDQRIENRYWAEITKTALQDAAAVVVLMSPDAYHNKWVQQEVHTAHEMHKPTFPLLLDGKSWTPRYVDVTNKQLPERSFFAQVAKYAPHYPAHGREFEPADILPYPTLRFTGMYTCETVRGESYLRFFEDGFLLEKIAEKASVEFQDLDHRHHRHTHEGRYEVKGRDITFTLSIQHAKVTYQGTIDHDRLELEWHNHGTKKRGEGLYTFTRTN
jgi:hypothetical protein